MNESPRHVSASAETSSGSEGTNAASPRRGPSNRWFYLGMAVVAVLVAAGLALFASSSPDGLERVAEDVGFAESAQDSAVAGSPVADYELPGAQDPDSPLNRAFAGVVGVSVTAGVAFALFGALARGKARRSSHDG